MSVSITVQPNAGNTHLIITLNNSGSPSNNDLFRRNASEYDGEYIKIGTSIAIDGTFLDYNVRPGETQDYFARETVSGVTADSAVVSNSLSLANLSLHAVTKLSASQNLDSAYPLVSLLSQETHDAALAYAGQVFEFLGNSKRDLRVGAVREGQWTFPVIIPQSTDSVRPDLEELFAARVLLCIRTPNGVKEFGMLEGLSQNYQGLQTNLTLVFNESDYSEELI